MKFLNRGLKAWPDLAVLRATFMSAVLVYIAIIDNYPETFAQAVACGVTDYAAGLTNGNETTKSFGNLKKYLQDMSVSWVDKLGVCPAALVFAGAFLFCQRKPHISLYEKTSMLY